MTNDQIERLVEDLHGDLWRHRQALSGLSAPEPLSLCDPKIAARMLGLRYEELDGLGRFGDGLQRFETAGMLDRPQSLIAVSLKFEFDVRRFTGAHEVGHFAMHQGTLHHRDRPIFDLGSARPAQEREADYFAACFLIPPKLLRQEFRLRFGTKEPLPLNDTVAFYLTRGHAQELLGFPSGTLRFARAIASATSFGSTPFVSLARHFRVSPSAMAIRLKELGLIVD